MKNKILILIITFLLLIPITCMAEPPAKPDSEENMPGGALTSSSSVSYSGVLSISSSNNLNGKTYESTRDGQNAILVTDGNSTITNFEIIKTGNGSNETSDFYGNNAAIFVKNGSLNISNSKIETSGSYANGVFSYDKGVINISDSSITTTKNNSGGVMVTGGGTVNADNCSVKTSGDSSASIRSDRGGGTIAVTKGTYETSGKGSPAIYSTADITVDSASLNSTSSEGVVVEGANSVTLKNTKLTDNNVTLNGNSETYKNIFLYQSMSGDAESGTANFTSTNSTIDTKKGDTIFVTNTTAKVNLTNNTITNLSGDFLRIEKGKWGTSGFNGGNVTLTLDNQKVEGSIIVDKISTLDMNMKNKSVLKSSINSDKTAKKLKLVLSSDSALILEGDSYLTELNNETNNNDNIYLNGHTLYVDGEKVSANNGTYKEKDESIDDDTNKEETNQIIEFIKNHLPLLGATTALVILLSTVIITIIKRNKKNSSI